jgi:hypothetical protein
MYVCMCINYLCISNYNMCGGKKCIMHQVPRLIADNYVSVESIGKHSAEVIWLWHSVRFVLMRVGRVEGRILLGTTTK